MLQITTEYSKGILLHILELTVPPFFAMDRHLMTPAGSKIHTNGRGAIILHLVVHRANETGGEWKEERDKLQSG